VVLFLMAVAMGVVAAAIFFWPYMPGPAMVLFVIDNPLVSVRIKSCLAWFYLPCRLGLALG
jgi:hypothetical protein